MKLSKTQLEVIRLIKEGRIMHRDIYAFTNFGVTLEGDKERDIKVSQATWFKLYKLGLVKHIRTDDVWDEVYELTEAGKNVTA